MQLAAMSPAFALTLTLLSCLIPTRVSASAALMTLFGRSDYHHHVTLGSSFSPVEFLAAFDLGDDGTFDVKFDVKFTMDTTDDGDGRVMLYLLACDERATTLLSLPSNSSASTNDTLIPSYCAMANRTLDYYCQTFPLENESPDDLVYQSSKTIRGSMDNVTTQPEFIKRSGSNSTKFTFYIDACELVGGDKGILRSCLDHPPPASHTYYSSCFYCPQNYPGRSEAENKRWSKECVTPPAIWDPVEGTVAMELCTVDGDCMWETNTYLVTFYAASTVLWGAGCLIWLWHMGMAPAGSVVALHYKLLSVPITQVVYTTLSFAAKNTAGQFASPNFNMVAIAALVAQVVALAVSAEVALFIAGGWGITQAALDRVDVFRIRCVVVEWALAFVVLKQLEVNNIGIAVIWGISWFSILLLIHYYGTANLKMLRLRYRIGEQANIDTSLVMWKGALFLHYRRLQKGFVFIATITSLTGSDNHWRIWKWISVQGHEILIFLLYAALAYICRCQQFRFSELENLEIDVGGETEGTEAARTQDNASADPVSSSNVVPVIEEPVLKRKKVATALILNPDKSIMLGTAYAIEKLASSDISQNEVRATCDTSGGAHAATSEQASRT
ncbi:hypothetical protein PRIC1_006489 [Phytophthora ramorum]